MAKEKKRAPGRPKVNSEPSVHTATRLPADRHRQLVQAAEKLERPPAWVMRKAVEEWLDRNASR